MTEELLEHYRFIKKSMALESMLRFLSFVKRNKIDKIDGVHITDCSFTDTVDFSSVPPDVYGGYCIIVKCDCDNMHEYKEFSQTLKKKMKEDGLYDLVGKTLVVCPRCFK